jgi:anti-sigma factor RsiW
MTFHLTHEQLCGLVAADLAPDAALAHAEYAAEARIVEEHLRACAVCAAELETLRGSLGHFREASISYTREQFARSTMTWSSIAPAPHRYLSQPLYWAAAVFTVAVALLPLGLRHHGAQMPSASQGVSAAATTAAVQAAESDEELLADIDDRVSVDVPAPLEPLAGSSESKDSVSSSNQRKN